MSFDEKTQIWDILGDFQTLWRGGVGLSVKWLWDWFLWMFGVFSLFFAAAAAVFRCQSGQGPD